MRSLTTIKQARPGLPGVKLNLLAATLGLLALGTADLSATPNRNPGIAPIHSKPHGKSYSEWAAAWWQWAFSIPADVNPVLDTTGENADEGQNGPVWFLAGNFGGTTEREVWVPEGKSLFFPILNQPWVQFPTDPPYTIPELRTILRAMTDNAILSCEIDGRPVRNLASYREESVVFTTTVPDGNILGLPAGDYAPCLDNGYYLMLAPLSRGQHTIHFTAETADHSFSLDVTYRLNVGGHARIVPPDHRYRGKDYSEWSAAYWQWLFALPVEGHPGTDTPDFDVTDGQSGHVWFLTGPFGTAERDVTIPAGTALFIALVNVDASSLEEPPFYGATAADQLAIASGFADYITDLSFTVDGKSVAHIGDFRVTSPQFSFTAPTPWIFGATGGTGTATGVGYFVMLAPLSVGKHTIHYTGAFKFSDAPEDYIGVNMTYHITVVPPQATIETGTATATSNNHSAEGRR